MHEYHQPQPIPVEDVPWALTLQCMARGAMELHHLIDQFSSEAYEFGDAARAALQSSGVRCGSTDRLQMLKLLAFIAGSWFHLPDTRRISDDLLRLVCHECARVGRPWLDGRAELKRRSELKGLHRLVWWLRDQGLVGMNGVRYARDPEPMFP